MFPKHRSETLAGTVLPLCSFGKTVGGVVASRYADSTCNEYRLAKGGDEFGKTVGLAGRSLSPSKGSPMRGLELHIERSQRLEGERLRTRQRRARRQAELRPVAEHEDPARREVHFVRQEDRVGARA
jgi:hypothetical protein